MKYPNVAAKDFAPVIRKLSLEEAPGKRGKHPVYWYLLDGKKTLRITLPNTHGGSHTLTPGFLKQIRDALRLSGDQLVDLIECPLSAEEYAAIVRSAVGRV